jgi:NADH dehydrogenase/NADH:ubiquinone oxidoreductase subunit G
MVKRGFTVSEECDDIARPRNIRSVRRCAVRHAEAGRNTATYAFSLLGDSKQQLADVNRELIEVRGELAEAKASKDAVVIELLAAKSKTKAVADESMHELAEATASKDAVVIELHSELEEARASRKMLADKLERAKKKLAVTTLLYTAGKGALEEKDAELTKLSVANAGKCSVSDLKSIVYLYWNVVTNRDQLLERNISLERQVLILLSHVPSDLFPIPHQLHS